MPTVRARAIDDTAKRTIKRIGDRYDEPHEAGAASGRQQGQQKTQSKQRIDHIEDVIDDLRYTSCSARASHFALSLDNLVDSLGAELAGQCTDPLAFRWRCLRSLLGYLSLYFAFSLRFDRSMLTSAARFIDRQFVVVHDLPPREKTTCR